MGDDWLSGSVFLAVWKEPADSVLVGLPYWQALGLAAGIFDHSKVRWSADELRRLARAGSHDPRFAALCGMLDRAAESGGPFTLVPPPGLFVKVEPNPLVEESNERV